MKTISLTRGKVTVVDDEDYERASSFKWNFNGNYAVRSVTVAPKTRKAMLLHRFLTQAPDSCEVDHRDRDGLNNQRSNLRVCHHLGNSRNKSMPHRNKVGFKGVYKFGNKFRANIRVNYKLISLGLFNTPVEAAMAYNDAAVKYFGEFAAPNQIP